WWPSRTRPPPARRPGGATACAWENLSFGHESGKARRFLEALAAGHRTRAEGVRGQRGGDVAWGAPWGVSGRGAAGTTEVHLKVPGGQSKRLLGSGADFAHRSAAPRRRRRPATGAANDNTASP